MSHDSGDNSRPESDPDQQGDLHGQAPNGNEDGDDLGSMSPPPVGPVTIPSEFVTFVDGLPAPFVQAFEADAPGGVAWTPVVISSTDAAFTPTGQPVALFAAIDTPQPSPLLLSGNVVGLISDGTAPLTVADSATPTQYIATGTGGMTLFATAANGSFVAEGGTNTVVLGTKNMGAWTIDMLGGTNQVWATGGNDTVETATGSTNFVAFGAGNDLALSAGNDLFFGGAGNDTINASGAQVSAVGGSGGMTFIDANTVPGGQNALIFGGSGVLNVQGGVGSVTVVAGAGGGAVFGGAAGNNVLVGGSGPVTLVGGGGGDLLVGGSTGGAALVAGSGNETLIAGSGGNNQIWGGTGNDIIVMTGGNNTVVGGSGGSEIVWSGSGANVIDAEAANLNVIAGLGGNDTVQAGTGSDIFTFTNGGAGGTTVIDGFNAATDRIMLNGYAANSASISASGGSTPITLSDKTQIQLIGLASLPASAIG